MTRQTDLCTIPPQLTLLLEVALALPGRIIGFWTRLVALSLEELVALSLEGFLDFGLDSSLCLLRRLFYTCLRAFENLLNCCGMFFCALLDVRQHLRVLFGFGVERHDLAFYHDADTLLITSFLSAEVAACASRVRSAGTVLANRQKRRFVGHCTFSFPMIGCFRLLMPYDVFR